VIIPNNGLFPDEIIQNMEINQQRFTTQFDIYITLHQLPYYFFNLESEGKKFIANNKFTQLKEHPNHKQSINYFFNEVPYSRTCGDAGLLFTFCLCSITKNEKMEINFNNNINFLKIKDNAELILLS
jgi:hypothetical protein